jgi:hypothetical protein
MYEIAKKHNIKDVYDVLKQITGEDISVIGNILKVKDNLKEDD